MDEITKILIERLLAKGMRVNTISAYVRDLANSLAVNACLSIQDLNRRLQSLGWNDLELDDHTFQLILAIFEADSMRRLGQRRASWIRDNFNPSRIVKIHDLNNKSKERNH